MVLDMSYCSLRASSRALSLLMGHCLCWDAAAYIPQHQHAHALKQQGIKILQKLTKEDGQEL